MSERPVMPPLHLSHFTAVSAVGRGIAETAAALEQKRGGLAPCAFETVDLPTHIGEVRGVDAISLPERLVRFDCRNNRLAQLGLLQDDFMQAVARSATRWGRTAHWGVHRDEYLRAFSRPRLPTAIGL